MTRPMLCILLVDCAIAFAGRQVHADDASGATSKGFDIAFVRLLQPEWIVGQRTKAEYLARTIQAIATAAGAREANACVVHVAIRPERRFKTWTACSVGSEQQDVPEDMPELDAHIAAQLNIEDVADTSGLVVFSIHGPSAPDGLPSAWSKAASAEGTEVDRLVDRIWPE